MTDTTDLFPCPACGSHAVESAYLRFDDGSTQPGCTDCRATGPIEEWAMRVASRSAIGPTDI